MGDLGSGERAIHSPVVRHLDRLAAWLYGRRQLEFLDDFQFSLRVAVGAQADEAIVVFVEIRPDQGVVGRGDLELIDRVAAEEFEMAFVDRAGQGVGRDAAIEQEHEPVAGALIAFFRDIAEAVQVVVGQFEADFFMCFTAGAFVGGLAGHHVELAADRAPATFIRCFQALYKQMLTRCVADENEGTDFERKWRWHKRLRFGRRVAAQVYSN